jgi:hypothetical protein
MATTVDRIQQLEQRRAALKRQVSEAGDLRPGSLVARYRRCGKAGCHCAGTGAVSHGPSWSLTREVEGKTVTRVIPPDAVARTRAQVDEYHRFRTVVRELVETSEQLCDAKLATPNAIPSGAAQEGGFIRRSRARSPTRSTRS